MIAGAGVDVEEVERVRSAIERHGRRFLERIFTPAEIAYVEPKANRYERYTARFAAKEAAMKALGSGWDQGVGWRDIEVLNREGGRPELHFHGRAAEIAGRLGCQASSISLSHTRSAAVALVILEA